MSAGQVFIIKIVFSQEIVIVFWKIPAFCMKTN